jgi:hypothetical protein
MNFYPMTTDATLAQYCQLLDALAHEDALKIFLAAKPGITHSTHTRKKLGLTQKRYYTRLRQLLKAGLLERRDDGYFITTMGSIVYTISQGICDALQNSDRLTLADRLQNTKSISADEAKQILKAISCDNLAGAFNLADVIHPITLIKDYEQYIDELVNKIDLAQQSIHLICHYTDIRVMEAVIRALNRGVRFTLLTSDQEDLVQKFRMIKMILIPKMAQLFFDMIREQGVRVRRQEVVYSYCIIDQQFVVIELPNPLDKTFYLGFGIQSRDIGGNLTIIFEELYRQGEDDPIVNILQKDIAASNFEKRTMAPEHMKLFPYL